MSNPHTTPEDSPEDCDDSGGSESSPPVHVGYKLVASGMTICGVGSLLELSPVPAPFPLGMATGGVTAWVLGTGVLLANRLPRHKAVAIALVVVTVLAAGLWGARGYHALFPSDTTTPVNDTLTVPRHDITWWVYGDATNVNIAHAYGPMPSVARQNSTLQPTLPWRDTRVVVTREFMRATIAVYIGESGGTATCELVIDGIPVDNDTATGQGSIAYCYGFLVDPRSQKPVPPPTPAR